MTDLVERLREVWRSPIGEDDTFRELYTEAADELERLEAVRTGLLARCDQLADHRNSLQWALKTARATIAEHEDTITRMKVEKDAD